MEERLRTVIGVWPTVQLQPPDALPRTEFKARRVIDNRDLFHSLRGGG
jgi:phenylacetate-CoA ligase